jgi:membrane-bound serine protease (ClpP class)
MTVSIQVYWILLVLGILMLGAEIFLPGGLLGILGAVCLVSAATVGFWAFGPQLGFLSLLGIVVFTGIGLAVWIRFFPRTAIGQRLELKRDGHDFKSHPDHRMLIGKTGTAVSVLRPSGIAAIDGKRVDVVADGDWIEEGSPIIVTRVEGPRIEVRRIEAPQKTSAENKGGA